MSMPKGGYRHVHRAIIPESTLTFREQKVLGAIRAATQPITVQQLAKQCFPGFRAKPDTYETTGTAGEKIRHATAPAYRAVLNSLRRLVVGSYVTKTDRGTYAVINQHVPAPPPAAVVAPIPDASSQMQKSPSPEPPKPEPTRPVRSQKETPMIATKGVLYAVLSQLCKVTDRSSSMPALSHLRIVSSNGTAHLTTTDLTSTLSTTISAEGNFDRCLPAKPLLDFIKPTDRADRESVVEFESVENGQVVVAYDGAMTTLSSLPVKDYPVPPGEKHAAQAWQAQAEWDASEFAEKLGWVILAVGLDETRRHLGGVYFDKDQVVALDGHRLHLASLPSMAAGSTLVAGKSISALLHVLPKKGQITVSRAKDVLRFTVGNWQLETNIMTETFPPYEQVVPSESSETFHAAIGREKFAKAMAKMPKPTRNGGVSGVRLKLNGKLEIERDGDGGTSTSSVPFIETTHTGAEFIVGVNSKYLVDALSDGADTIMARFSDPLSPIRIDMGGDRVAVLMPMRL